MAAKKGSLLGWATSATPSLPPWQCPACTLNNKGGNLACSACGSKAPSSSASVSTRPPLSWDCPACTLTNNGNLTCAACGGPRLEGQGKTGDKLVGMQPGKRKRSSSGDPGSKVTLVNEPLQHVLGTNRNIQTNNTSLINDNQPIKEPPVLCTGHSKPCLVKKVSQMFIHHRPVSTKTISKFSLSTLPLHWSSAFSVIFFQTPRIAQVNKEGPNKLRLFHCCSLPRAKQCQHFSWADLHHPKVKILKLSCLSIPSFLVQVWTADHSEGSIQAKPEQWERIFHMPSIKEGTAMRFLPVELVQQFPCAVIP